MKSIEFIVLYVNVNYKKYQNGSKIYYRFIWGTCKGAGEFSQEAMDAWAGRNDKAMI